MSVYHGKNGVSCWGGIRIEIQLWLSFFIASRESAYKIIAREEVWSVSVSFFAL
ncbi:hypothetical protein PP707_02015 [Acetobacter pasteurianus]|nr:hypothetical protein [Acetobacter pasteurianus]